VITVSVFTSESSEPSKFDVEADWAAECVKRLAVPDEVLIFTPRSGVGTAYIPVRHIVYLHVSDDHNPADPSH
jgi:hypothetical protein